MQPRRNFSGGGCPLPAPPCPRAFAPPLCLPRGGVYYHSYYYSYYYFFVFRSFFPSEFVVFFLIKKKEKKSGKSPKTFFSPRQRIGAAGADAARSWRGGGQRARRSVCPPAPSSSRCPAGSAPRSGGATCPRCSPVSPRRAPVTPRVIWLVQQLHRD